MHKWLWSKIYDKGMKDAEAKGLQAWRSELLSNISGEILELGCGTGANLAFYPSTVQRLVLVEPNIHMHKDLKNRIAKNSNVYHIEILQDKAESLSLADASFDTVVCTLVLCSVTHLEKSLSEINRILKPRGKLIFIEHVAAMNNINRYRWQRRLEFLWKRVADGCHLTRNTEDALIKSGFEIINI